MDNTKTIQDPNTPRYNRETGLLTDYGRSLGLKEVNRTITPDILKQKATPLDLSGVKQSEYNPVSVTSYKDNPDGTTTNFLNDGSSDTGTYTKNQDGTYNFNPSGQSQTSNQMDYLTKLLMGENFNEANVNQSIDRTKENEARALADSYTTQIEKEDKRLRDDIQRLRETNSTGMSVGALQATASDMERKSLSKQADLALLQSAASRDYGRLNSIAEQQVQNNLAQIKAKQANLALFIGQLDKKEQREYDTVQKKVDREYQRQEKNETLLANIKTSVAQYAGANAPIVLAKLSAIDTTKPDAYGKALEIAYKYTTDPLDKAIKQAQLDKLRTETQETKSKMSTVTGGGAVSTASQGAVDVARELLANPDLGAITGTVQQLTGGFLGSNAKLAKNKWKQLKGILSLENRQMLKGSGAISDFEFRVLGEASSALGRNLSDETFKTELTKLITRLSPEYQYIEQMGSVIDSSGTALQVNNYVNSLYK